MFSFGSSKPFGETTTSSFAFGDSTSVKPTSSFSFDPTPSWGFGTTSTSETTSSGFNFGDSTTSVKPTEAKSSGFSFSRGNDQSPFTFGSTTTKTDYDNFSSSLVVDLYELLYKTHLLADFTLEITTEKRSFELQVHKALLAASCGFFKSMWSQQPLEQATQTYSMKMSENDVQVFEDVVLRFIYLGHKIRKPVEANLVSSLVLSDYLQMPLLREELGKQITSDNVVTVLVGVLNSINNGILRCSEELIEFVKQKCVDLFFRVSLLDFAKITDLNMFNKIIKEITPLTDVHESSIFGYSENKRVKRQLMIDQWLCENHDLLKDQTEVDIQHCFEVVNERNCCAILSIATQRDDLELKNRCLKKLSDTFDQQDWAYLLKNLTVEQWTYLLTQDELSVWDEDSVFEIVQTLILECTLTNDEKRQLWETVRAQYLSPDTFMTFVDQDISTEHLKQVMKHRTLVQANKTVDLKSIPAKREKEVFSRTYVPELDKNDKSDIFYWLGTGRGKSTYMNPVDNGEIRIVSHVNSDAKKMLDYNNVIPIEYEDMEPPKSFSIQFNSIAVSPTTLIIKTDQRDNYKLIGKTVTNKEIDLGYSLSTFRRDTITNINCSGQFLREITFMLKDKVTVPTRGFSFGLASPFEERWNSSITNISLYGEVKRISQ